jgi:endonuclease I/chitodextrinase
MKKTLLLLSLFFTLFINAQAESYYDGVDLSAEGSDLKENLATKTINSHTNFLSYTPGVWDALKVTDLNPVNNSEVLLIYGYSASGTTARTRDKNSNGGGQGDWNREHTFAKSLGSPNLGSTGPGADAHHLRPSDVGYNSDRGNFRFVDGSGTSGNVSGGWYPGDEWKGDVARMMMYMYIRYGNQCKPNAVGIGTSADTEDDMINLFLKWNAEDAVSDFERQRNAYHDSNQSSSQGNRNPFIDNAYLATRIWGGTPAEDSWGIYTSNDNEAPTVPTNVVLSNITTTSMNVSWSVSSDNVAVTAYEIFVDGSLKGNTSSTNYSITNLNSGTNYSISVLAKDIANNKSAQSTAVNGITLTDATAPSIPNNVTITGETGTSFKVNWTASTDDSGVTGYDVHINGSLHGSTTNVNYNVVGLTASTTYSARVSAKDQAGNISAQSAAITATTTNGSNNIVELFFSEYAEGGGNNKALEIANITENVIDLSGYSIKKQSNGAGAWINELPLSGSIAVNDVFVLIHFQATNDILLGEADLVAPQGSNYGAPINFNGNDPVGLFKNGVLIDIIGVLGETAKNFENMTLRRKNSITKPNITYTANEWEQFPQDTFDGIGSQSNATASVNDHLSSKIKMYPNPANGTSLFIKTSEKATITIYNLLGKAVKKEIISATSNKLDISNLTKGMYIVKINIDHKTMAKKLIKN